MRIAFDLDGTLAFHLSEWENSKIGPPLEPGMALLKEHIGAGDDCFIYTARPQCQQRWISEWLKANGIENIRIVCEKEKYDMLVDDRAHGWPRNLGA